ncbi:MAG: ferritin [Rhodobacterales bacterium]|nr:MAG: ferritin [Rhodobacterales bacterium]
MRLDKTVANIINDQVNHELDASYKYLGMAAYFDSVSLPGFAAWFRAHSQEENEHAMRLYDFLVSLGIKVELKALAAPKTEYASPAEAVKAALAHEEVVTEQIKTMFRVAHEAQEFTTQPMLHWFLAEQVEEEDLFNSVLDRVEAAENRFHLLQLDQELGGRKAGEDG